MLTSLMVLTNLLILQKISRSKQRLSPAELFPSDGYSDIITQHIQLS